MARTALTLGEPPESMPIWARLQLASLGHRFARVTHFLRNEGFLIAAVDGKPVALRKAA